MQTQSPSWPDTWRCGGRRLGLDQPRLMGVLNVTPDSFSDGGRFASPEEAAGAAARMVQEGAGIIDVGPESTRPGAEPIDVDEQIRRAVPVIERIRRQDPKVLISIDTTRAAVAEAAIDAGADIINDVSAGTEDATILAVAAQGSAGLILMHRLRPPDQDQFSDRYDEPPVYGDVVETVRAFLADRIIAAVAAGVEQSAIVIDPGLGFGKTVTQNYELIARSAALGELGCPVLSAASRKSFIGKASGEQVPAHRLPGSLAVSVMHYLAGIRLFRVHDVAAHRQALAVTAAVARASE